MTQLTLNDKREHQSIPVTLPRGDTKAFEGELFRHDLQAAEIQAVKLTVRQVTGTDAGTAVIELTSDQNADQFDYSVDYYIEIQLNATDTEALRVNERYVYGIEITDFSNRIYTPFTGDFSFIDDVVWDDSDTAAYLTRRKLYEYENLVEGVLACANGTLTSVASSSGASTFSVNSIGIFSASDSIVVELDDGTREKHDILSIASSTITLDGTTLGDAVAKGRVVMKVG